MENICSSRQSKEHAQAGLTEWRLGATCPAEVLLPLRVPKKLQAALLGCTAHMKSHQSSLHQHGLLEISTATGR
jgi:hypothetical protein